MIQGERDLAAGQSASLWVERSGPRAIDVAAALRERCAERWPEAAPVILGSSWGCGSPGTGVVGGGKELLNEIMNPYGLQFFGATTPGLEALVSAVPLDGVDDLQGVQDVRYKFVQNAAGRPETTFFDPRGHQNLLHVP